MKPTLEKIIAFTGSEFQVQAKEIRSKRRTQRVVIARNLVCYLGYKIGGHSKKNIGRLLGRDHTTIMHAIDSAEERLRKSGEFRGKTMTVLNRIEGKLEDTKRIIEKQSRARTKKSEAEVIGISETAYKNGVRGVWPEGMMFDLHPDANDPKKAGKRVFIPCERTRQYIRGEG